MSTTRLNSMSKPQQQRCRCFSAVLGLIVSIEAFRQQSWKERSNLRNLWIPIPVSNPRSRCDQTTIEVHRQPTLLWNKNENHVFEEISGDEEGTIKEELLKVAVENQPSQWTVTKEVLGLNVFTLILALLIAFFMGSNIILGPGWLGSRLGIAGTGTFSEVSKSLPEIIDLSQVDYLL